MSGVASTPTATMAVMVTARSPAIAPASRSAASVSPRARSRVYSGISEAERAPSPNRFWRKLGIRNAALRASAASVAWPK